MGFEEEKLYPNLPPPEMPINPENQTETIENEIEREEVAFVNNLEEVTTLIDQADPEKFSEVEAKSIKGKLMLIFGSLGILGGGYAMKQLLGGAPSNELALVFGGVAGLGGGTALALQGLVETIKVSKFGKTKLGKFLTSESDDPGLPPPDMIM
ncbi:MAG: hypothetical protein WCV71_03980 [Patescibacteria group bacterium]|jgi:hypothetical protein